MVFRQPPVPETPSVTPVMSKDEITAEVNSAVKAALQKYFPQINFSE